MIMVAIKNISVYTRLPNCSLWLVPIVESSDKFVFQMLQFKKEKDNSTSISDVTLHSHCGETQLKVLWILRSSEVWNISQIYETMLSLVSTGLSTLPYPSLWASFHSERFTSTTLSLLFTCIVLMLWRFDYGKRGNKRFIQCGNRH